MATSTNSKSTSDIIRTASLFLTPIAVAVLGYLGSQRLSSVQTDISRVQTEIANVSALKPFMEMVADTDVTKSKLGAYAIYMLKKDDPETVAQLILAPGQEHLVDVLVDIGSRDTAIKNEVDKIISDVDFSAGYSENLTIVQQSAIEILDKINVQEVDNTIEPAGWLYLGNYKHGPKAERLIKSRPEKGIRYELLMDTNVRADRPVKPKYRLPETVGLAYKGSMITIMEFEEDNKGHIWANVVIEDEVVE